MSRYRVRILAPCLLIALGGCESTPTTTKTTHADGIGNSAEPASATSTKVHCALEIDPPEEARLGDYIQLTAHIRNDGNTPVTLVQPGDGSNCGWRTPIVGWSVLPADSTESHPANPPLCKGGRCGNVNALKPDEIFTLQPGESRELSGWLGPLPIDADGAYRVHLYYTNDPDIKWSGLPLSPHDPAAMRRLKDSTPVQLISNELKLHVIR
jgi:hypothetical protein